MDELAAVINAAVSGTVFMGCVILIATFWMH